MIQYDIMKTSKRYFLWMILGFLSAYSESVLWSQISDNFSDNDFAANPAWAGDVAEWTVENGALRTNGPAVTGTITSLTTPSTTAMDTQWEFFANPKCATSSGNFMDIYVISDMADLESSGNGYFIRLGGTPDEISLYKKTNGTTLKIIDGTDGTINSSTDNPLRIKLTRDSGGTFFLWTDDGTTGNYLAEGSVSDADFTTSSYFGISVLYSQANATKYWFDDLVAGPIQIDTTPPSLTGILVLNSHQLQVSFSEAISPGSITVFSNYNVNGIGSPVDIAFAAGNSSVIILSFGQDFLLNQQMSLTMEGISDNAGNTASSIVSIFTYQIATVGDIIITEFLSDPDPVVGLPDAEFVELYNRSGQAININGWTFSDASSDKTLPDFDLPAGSYVILCPEANLAAYELLGLTIGLSSFPSLNNTGDLISIKTPQGFVSDEVEYELSWWRDAVKDDGGWSLERISLQNLCPGPGNWIASLNNSGGTPGLTNSVNGLYPDNEAPVIETIIVSTASQITIDFSEPLDATIASVTNNYILTPSIDINGAEVNDNQVTLTLSSPLQIGNIYLLDIGTASDCLGNTNTALQAQVAIPQTPEAFDVAITEIMADPEPKVGLPLYEYIEIQNVSDKIFDLKDWTISDEGSPKLLPNYLLFPDQRLIITSAQATGQFSDFGEVMGIDFPSITNTGEILKLSGPDGLTIHQVSFLDSWYNDPVKKSGGWSLEMIDPTNPCAEAENWTASLDSKGGTPGQINSANGNTPDLSLPVPVRVTYNNIAEISVVFSEIITGSAATSPASYTINNGIGNPIFVSINDTDNKQADLILPIALQAGSSYTLTIAGGITDCAGNLSVQTVLNFGAPENALPGDIVINEILPNPVTDNVDYVEFYNKSSKILDLKQLRIASGDLLDPETIVEVETITETSFLLFPGEIVAITERPDLVQLQYNSPAPDRIFQCANLPSYNDTEGVVVLTDNGGQVLDHLQYTQDWHYELIDDFNGVSLERIDPYGTTQNKNNWHSAASTVHFGTPGYKNSSFVGNITNDAAVKMVEDFFSPDSDGQQDFAVIAFNLNESGYTARVKVFDERGRPVRSLSNNELLGTQGFIQWDGIMDDGQRAPIGIYAISFEYFDLGGKSKKEILSVTLNANL